LKTEQLVTVSYLSASVKMHSKENIFSLFLSFQM